MIESYEAVRLLVVDKLEQITVANGYYSDATILDGWLTFYAKDLIQGVNGMGFPAVSVHYDKDAYKVNGGSIDALVNRTIKVTGAVTTNDPTEVNKKLDELLKDIKVAMGTDRKLTISEADFMLPEGNDPYAMFVISVNVDVNEKWEK